VPDVNGAQRPSILAINTRCTDRHRVVTLSFPQVKHAITNRLQCLSRCTAQCRRPAAPFKPLANHLRRRARSPRFRSAVTTDPPAWGSPLPSRCRGYPQAACCRSFKDARVGNERFAMRADNHDGDLTGARRILPARPLRRCVPPGSASSATCTIISAIVQRT
jgi:hypothetical protein